VLRTFNIIMTTVLTVIAASMLIIIVQNPLLVNPILLQVNATVLALYAFTIALLQTGD
jgi:hypothetical protein